MSGLELVPIGTILSLLVDQVKLTANAINEVLIEKECFKTLSKYLLDIAPIFEELQHHGLNDTPTVRRTLEFLKQDCDKAEILVQKYSNCGRFYSCLFCRRIANEIQEATRAIGRSLAILPLAKTEVLYEISNKVNRLQAEMQKAEYVASQSSLMILDKLDKAITEQKFDQNFKNSMLKQIALSVGVSIEPSEIREELDSLRIEREKAAERKEKQEEIFLKQVIELLSHADAALDEDEIKKQYELIKNIVEKSAISNGTILPFAAFICPLTGSVMVDPVNLSTGTTCERTAIEARFLQGCKEDPHTGQVLKDLKLRPNISLRHSIQQWREQNYLLNIRRSREILQSTNLLAYDDAFSEITKVIKENVVTKYWIAMEGLIDIIVLLVERLDGNLKSRSLQTLLDIVERHSHNKDKAVAAGVLNQIVLCVGIDYNVCMSAANLLFELLQENGLWGQDMPQMNCGWNENLCRKLKQQRGAIAFLVLIILDKQYTELSKKMEDILLQLCCDDDDTILVVASYHWYKPLVQRLFDGPESSKQSMMRGLEGMQLLDEDVKQLGEDEVINPLVRLALGDAESKELAFSVMSKLCTSYENRRLIIEAGAVSSILELIFSPQVSTSIREKCSEIFEKLTSSCLEFLTSPDVTLADQKLMITKLIAVLENSGTSIGIRKPTFRALLSICKSAMAAAEGVIATPNGLARILPLLEDSDNEIQKLALQLIQQFYQHEPSCIADFLLDGRRLERYMCFLEDDSQPELQFLAMDLLTGLQKSKLELINGLVKSGAVPIILNILNRGTMEAKETVLDLLSGFMNPADLDMQKIIVQSGAYPLLVNILKSGSRTAKARAAALISDLSSNSPKLTKAPMRAGCFSFLRKEVPACEVHGGICSVESSFCLLKAGALPPLVKLLQERDDAVKLKAILAMKTLVQGTGSRGAIVLHNLKAIKPMLDVLSEENPALKEEVLEMLEMVFKVRVVSDSYSNEVRIPLIQLSSYCSDNSNENLKSKAAKLLYELKLNSESGSMPQ